MNDKFIIMLVDRNRHIREFLRRELFAEGYLVVEARNEKDMLEILRSDNLPDLMILDLDMPVDCALAFLELLRTWEVILPVVIYTFLTDYSNHPVVRYAEAFVEKSEDLTQLKRSVADVLQWRYPQRYAQA